MITDFLLSYLAGNIPLLKDIFAKNETFESRLEDCYQRALKSWTVNGSIRSNSPSSFASINALKDYLSEKPDIRDKGLSQLLGLWTEELRNDSICYNFILENKTDLVISNLDSYYSSLKSLLDGKLDYSISLMEKLNRDVEDLKANKGSDYWERIEAFVRKTVTETVEPLISQLRVRSAITILRTLESSFDVKADNRNLIALLSYHKGRAYMYVDRKLSITAFHEAYLSCPDNQKYVVEEAKLLCEQKKLEDAYELCRSMSDDVFAAALTVARSENIAGDAFSTVAHQADKPVFLQTIAEILAVTGGEFVDGLFRVDYIEIPQNLTYDNLPKWIYAIGCYRSLLGRTIPLNREGINNIEDYRKASDISDHFVHYLNGTDLAGSFNMVRLLSSYWGYIVEGDSARIEEYQSVPKDGLGEQKNIFTIMESALLQMDGRTPEAFALLSGLKEEADELLINFCILLGFNSNEAGYITWGLNLAADSGITLDTNTSNSLCIAINSSNALVIQQVLERTSFENDSVAILVSELCGFFIGRTISVESLKNSYNTLPESMLPFSAMLLSQGGENDIAFNILRSRVDEKTPDFKFKVFVDVLTKSPEHRPLLYSMLKSNREAGFTEDNQLLLLEFQMATELSDFENAFETISIVYDRQPESEPVFLNYLGTLGKVNPILLEEQKQKVISFRYSSSKAVSFVYNAYAQSGYVDFAAEFLHKYAISLDDDDLKFLFYIQSEMGFIKNVVCKEQEYVKVGDCLVFENGDGRNALIVSERTPLGKASLGLKKGDTFSIRESTYTIMGIFPKLFKLHDDYIREVSLSGGNDHLRMFRINSDGDILQELRNAVNEVNPDSINYEKRKREYLSKYESGQVPLSSLADESYIIGSYYRLLFGKFKMITVPVSAFTPLKPFMYNSDVRFVLDLPAMIALFEFSNSTGYIPSKRFLVSRHLKDYVATKKEYYKYNPGGDFYESLNNKHLHHFSDNYQEDVNLRMCALCEWIDNYCEAVVDDKSLVISKHKDSESALLFSHTMSLILESSNVLVSDEWFYLKNLGGKIRQVSTEFFISEIERKHEQYVQMMMDSNVIGATMTDEQISDEILKSERGKESRLQYVFQSVSKNPDLFVPSINSGLTITRAEILTNSLRLTLTNLFTMCFHTRTVDYFKDEEWRRIIKFLNQPYENCRVVRECLLAAKRIMFPVT